MGKKMENEMETRVIYLIYIGVIMGLYWDSGKEHGNCYSIMVILNRNPHL